MDVSKEFSGAGQKKKQIEEESRPDTKSRDRG